MTDDTHADSRLAAQLRALLAAIEASGRAILPGSNQALLQSTVDAAARIFGAAAASVCLVDEQEEFLEFKVAYGAGRDDILGLRIPVNQGIAGYVAMTGQPIAVSNVQQDARFSKDFASSTGYVPRSILATPLISGDRVIGVMEVLDKIDAPSFGMQDMELLGLFAHQAALAIHQSQRLDHLSAALVEGLSRIVAEHDGDGGARSAPASLELLSALAGAQDGAGESAEDLLAMADMFRAIAAGGPRERQACLQILATFAGYLQARPSFG